MSPKEGGDGEELHSGGRPAETLRRVWDGGDYEWNPFELQARKLRAMRGQPLRIRAEFAESAGQLAAYLKAPGAKVLDLITCLRSMAFGVGSTTPAVPLQVTADPFWARTLPLAFGQRDGVAGSSGGDGHSFTRREGAGQEGPAAVAAAADEEGCMSWLLTSDIDSLTLEFVTPRLEQLFQQQFLQQHFAWHFVLRSTLACSSCMAIYRMLSLTFCWGWTEWIILCCMRVVAAVLTLSVVMMLVPGLELWSCLMMSVGETSVSMLVIALQALAPHLLHVISPYWWGRGSACLTDAECSSVQSAYNAMPFFFTWLFLKAVRSTHLVQVQLVNGLVEMLTWLCVAFRSTSLSHLLKSAVPIATRLIVVVVNYPLELHQRKCFLRDADRRKADCQSPSAGEPFGRDRAPVALCRADTQAARMSCSDMDERMASAFHAMLPRVRPTPRNTPKVLHLHVKGCTPEDIPPALCEALEEALQAHGLQLQASYLLPGSLRLTIIVTCKEDWETAHLKVEQVMKELLRRNELMELMRAPEAVIQWGERLLFFRHGVKVGEEETRAPVLLDVNPRVIAAASQQELHVTLRIVKPGLPGKLSLVLRGLQSSLVLRVPYQAWLVQGRLLRITQSVSVRAWSPYPFAEVCLLEVWDGEVLSAPVPVLCSSEPQLLREVGALVNWLSTTPVPFMPHDDVLWALRYVCDFHRTLSALCPHLAAQQPQAPWSQHSGSTGGSSSGHSGSGMQGAGAVSRQVLRLAAMVRSSAPKVLALAVMLGLPSTARLLFERATASFMDCLLEEPQGGFPAPPAVGILLGSRHRGSCAVPADGSRAKALAHLLAATGDASNLVTTVLHLSVTSESAATVKVLQEVAAAVGLELDWDVPLPEPSDSEEPGGCSTGRTAAAQRLTAMELAVLRLPRSGRVARQALLGSTAAAEAWLAAVKRVTPGLQMTAGASDSCSSSVAAHTWVQELTRLAQRVTCEGGRMGLLLTFSDAQLEREWASHAVCSCSSLAAVVPAAALAFALLSLLLQDGRDLLQQLLSFLANSSCYLLLRALCERATTAVGAVLSPFLKGHGACLLLTLRPELLRCLLLPCWHSVMLAAVLQAMVIPMMWPLRFGRQVMGTSLLLAVRAAALAADGGTSWADWARVQVVLVLAAALIVAGCWAVERRVRQAWLRERFGRGLRCKAQK